MSSFVGDLWKKVGELNLSKLSGSSSGRPSSSFPFVFDETKSDNRTLIGPFTKFPGQDYEISSRKEVSIFRRVNVFVCRDRLRIEEAKRIVKALKTLKHPRILRYISSKESDSEVLLVTEWADCLKNGLKFEDESDEEWQTWARWSGKEVYEFLSKNVGKEISFSLESGNLWKTSSGEVKIALFNEEFSNENFDTVMNRNFPSAKTVKNDLIHFTESFDYLVTFSAGERISLIKRLGNCKRGDFLKFLALPELVRTRKLTLNKSSSANVNVAQGSPSASAPSQEVSLEEVQFLFIKGLELISKDSSSDAAIDDFMFLLSEMYCDFLGKHAVNSIPLTATLLNLIGSQGLTKLFTEKYAQDQIYPYVSALLGHPLPAMREVALKALEGLCEKLTAKTIGNDVLRQIARLQGDSEGSLRLKALTVLSGTLWSKLSDNLRAKICGPAVSRALADPFIPCRRSGLKLLKEGLNLLPPSEVATKIIPSVSTILIVEDAITRAEAFECMEKLILPMLKKSMITVKVEESTVETKNFSGVVNEGERIISASIPVRESVSTSASIVVASESVSTSTTNSLNCVPVSANSGKMRLGSIKKII